LLLKRTLTAFKNLKNQPPFLKNIFYVAIYISVD